MSLLSLFGKKTRKMWRRHELKPKYDVVVVGAGVHGLATAYYLARRGITRVAVLDKGYLGGGASGRNTAIIRANYSTPEGAPFYRESLKLYEELSRELDYNLLFSQVGHMTLGHSEGTVNVLRSRAEINRLCGINSRLIWPKEIRELVPHLNIECGHHPVMAALYHPPGGTIRHDAVVWGYAHGVDAQGAEIHTHTEVQDIITDDGHVVGVKTNRGEVKTNFVVNATAGWCSTIAGMVGVELPIETHPLQACVTEPVKPFLHHVVVSANLHLYIYQTERGEFVIGSEIDPYQSYSMRATLPTLENVSFHTVELFPDLRPLNVLRQWAGLSDMTPDYSPIIGEVPKVKGFILNVGWGTWGFKAGPIAGKMVAELIATGKTPDLIKPFSITRFYENRLINEKGAAAVSH